MSERHGWRAFLVCVTLALTSRVLAEPPAGDKKLETEKKRVTSAKEVLPRPARAVETTSPQELAVSVRHLDRLESGWSVAETDHFRVFHVQDRAVAEKEAIAAERAQAAARGKWFGDTYPDWNKRCDIFVYPTARDYSEATGAPPRSPGHSEIRAEGSRVLYRRIYVHADEAGMAEAILPHEVTHTVLAGQFGEQQVPRWADEGMAVLTEPRERIERHLRTLPRLRSEGRLYSARELISMKDYPQPGRIPAFYAESVSLTEFLTKAKDPHTLARFVRDGLRDGYETSLQRHYGWDFDELERRWRKHAFRE
jgi:hypothetical protein